MSGLKKFLNKRAEGLAKEKAIKEGLNPEDIIPTKTEKVYEIDKDLGIISYEKKVAITEESIDLTDEEFWDITNTFNKKVKQSSEDHAVILQKILENYSPIKIQQFADRFSELNS